MPFLSMLTRLLSPCLHVQSGQKYLGACALWPCLPSRFYCSFGIRTSSGQSSFETYPFLVLISMESSWNLKANSGIHRNKFDISPRSTQQQQAESSYSHEFFNGLFPPVPSSHLAAPRDAGYADDPTPLKRQFPRGVQGAVAISFWGTVLDRLPRCKTW